MNILRFESVVNTAKWNSLFFMLFIFKKLTRDTEVMFKSLVSMVIHNMHHKLLQNTKFWSWIISLYLQCETKWRLVLVLSSCIQRNVLIICCSIQNFNFNLKVFVNVYFFKQITTVSGITKFRTKLTLVYKKVLKANLSCFFIFDKPYLVYFINVNSTIVSVSVGVVWECLYKCRNVALRKRPHIDSPRPK